MLHAHAFDLWAVVCTFQRSIVGNYDLEARFIEPPLQSMSLWQDRYREFGLGSRKYIYNDLVAIERSRKKEGLETKIARRLKGS